MIVDILKPSGAQEFRSCHSTAGRPKWTKMGLFSPEWTKTDLFGLFCLNRVRDKANLTKWSSYLFGSILVQYSLQQCRGHSLEVICGEWPVLWLSKTKFGVERMSGDPNTVFETGQMSFLLPRPRAQGEARVQKGTDASCGSSQQLNLERSLKRRSSQSRVLKSSFLLVPSSLPHTDDTTVLCTPPLPLCNKRFLKFSVEPKIQFQGLQLQPSLLPQVFFISSGI